MHSVNHVYSTLILTTLTLTACGGGGSGTAGTNGAPSAADGNFGPVANGAEAIYDAARGLAPLASDPDGDPLTFAAASQPAHGTLVLNADGSFQYRHDGGAATNDSFTFYATDGQRDSNRATARITIAAALNEAPETRNGTIGTVAEGGVLDLDTSGGLIRFASDPNDDALTFHVERAPAHGDLTLEPGGALRYAHDGSEDSSDTFTWYADDGELRSATVTATVSVDPRNDPPTAVADSCLTTTGAAVNGTITAEDPDDSALAFTLSRPPSKGSVVVDGSTGTFRYTPNPEAPHGADTFEVTVADPAGARVSVVQTLVLEQRIMALGDSLTDGVTDGGSGNKPSASARVGYRRHLQDLLEQGGYAVDFVGSRSGGTSASPRIDDPDHEGEPALQDDQLADTVYRLLSDNPADIILLHIGTNDLNASPRYPSTPERDVRDILDEIDRWKAASGWASAVFIARIIDRSPGTMETTLFNNNVVNKVVAPRKDPSLYVVDQEFGAGINYGEDFSDDTANPKIHLDQTGYDKMAAKWYADLVASGVLAECPP